MDWSQSGQLLTGDCHGIIHLWQPQQSRLWHVDQRPYSAHSKSVEDIQWSPNEATVGEHLIITNSFCDPDFKWHIIKYMCVPKPL